MPQKAQLLLQIAQAAAREGRQQAALPQVAVNVWDTLTGGGHASLHQQQQQQRLAPGQGLGGAAGPSSSSSAGDRLASSLGLLGLGAAKPPLEGPGAGHLFPHHHALNAAAAQWAQQAQLSGCGPADTAALYDTASGHAAQLLSAAALQPQLFGAAGFGIGGLSPLAALQLQQQLQQRGGDSGRGAGARGASARLPQGPAGAGAGGAHRPGRFNSSIGLNKMIMNTHSARELLAIVRTRGGSFDFFNISSAIARVPKLVAASGGMQNDVVAKALVDDLAGLMAANIRTFDARGLANSAWAFGKLKYAPSQKLPALIAAAALERMDAFSAQNLSNLLWSFVYLHHRDERLMGAVAKKAIEKIDEFKPQELANVVWAFASMEHHDAGLMAAAGRRALALVDQFKEQELSNVVWAFAKLRHHDEALFAHLLAAVAAKLRHFLPQGVSNIAWALATAGYRDPALFEQLLAHCMADISSYDVQGLSNLLWACATLGVRDEAFLSAAVRECSCRAERMSSQNLSNALWACATLGYSDARALGSWADAVVHKVDLFEPQGLSNAAWAFAKLGYSNPLLFEALAEAALGKLELFTPQGLSNLAWAFATSSHYHPTFASRLADQVAKQAGGFSVQHCSMAAWAFATLRHYHPPAYAALLDRLAGQLGDAEPQNVANALWAYARVGHALGEHTAPLVEAAKRLLPRMNQQELCNSAWALGVLGELDVATWEQFCACAADVQGLTPEGVHQAFHAQLMLHSHIARARGVPPSSLPPSSLPTLPEPLLGQARHMWLTSAVDVHVSRLQADVSAALTLAGIPNTLEWLTDDGLFSVDIAFQVDGQPVAVEVDGSHHYTNSAPHLPLSEVLVRRRLLQDRGWQVINIGFLEWEALPDDPATKAAALLQLVAAELSPQQAGDAGDALSCFASALADEQQQQQALQAAAEQEAAPLPSVDSWGSVRLPGLASVLGLQSDSEVAAAAAAAVAAAVGGEAGGGVVSPSRGVPAGVALGVPVGALDAFGGWGAALLGPAAANPWALPSAAPSAGAQQPQDPSLLRSPLSPEQLVVGGPTSGSGSFSRRSSSSGGSGDGSAPASPGGGGGGGATASSPSSNAGSLAADEGTGCGTLGVPLFLWGDALTTSIWGPSTGAANNTRA